MLSRKMIAPFVTAISVLSLAAVSNAGLISIDIGTSAVKGVGPPTVNDIATGDYPGGFTGQIGAWNALNAGGNNTFQTAPVSTGALLQSGSATPTGVVFTITSTAGSGGLGFVPQAPNTTNLLRGDQIVLQPVNTGLLSWSFTGLMPGQSYDLIFFGGSDAVTTQDQSGPNSETYTVNNGGTPTSMIANGIASFTGETADSLGVISGSVNPDQGHDGWWSGLQIQGPLVPVPEPSTFVLAGLGLASLCFVGRRKKFRRAC